MIPGQAQQFFQAAAAQSGGGDTFQIDRGLRFNSADSSYLSTTIGSALTTYTLSFWVKRSRLGTDNEYIFSSGNAGLAFQQTSDKLYIYNGSSTVYADGVYRDVSAWYHIVYSVNSNSADIYVNNVQVMTSGSAPTLSTTSNATSIGAYYGSGTRNYFLNGYLAEVNFIDGQALAPTEFGETDSNNNWNPKDTSELTFGTNGFYLKFADNSSNSALGTDSSGNTNTWTVNNLVADVPSGSNGMNVATYTGNGSSQSITGLGFQPDFVWLKCRTSSFPNYLGDVVRGVNKLLKSNGNASEITSSTGITSFDSDGFTLGSGSETNTNGEDFVAWCWKAGGTASSNTDGSLTSSISASQTYGFSVVTWTGNRSSGATVGHGLTSTPKWVVVKNRDQSSNWMVYHSATGAGGYLALNNTNAYAAASSVWNSTAPDSSVFTLGADSESNGNGDEMVAYCWAEVPSYSSIGSYTGNGSTSGPTITTGFRPRYIILKASSFAGEDWVIMDTARAPSNPSNLLITANTNSLEYTNSVYNTDFNNDGFTIKNTNPRWNTNGETYIYAAFAEKPDQSIIDSLLDTPTNYEAGSGNNGGNYATLNPLNKHNSSDTISNGNLEASWSGGSACLQPSTLGFSSGKYYFEFSPGISGSIGTGVVGIRRSDSRNYDNDYSYLGNGNKLSNGSASSYGASYTDGDIIGVAVDMDAGTINFYKNGSDQGQAFSGISGTYTFYQGTYGGSSAGGYAVNFGQRPFAYTPPTGYKSLCTQNLSNPTIADGSTAMDVVTYTGTITDTSSQTVTGLDFQSDLVWIKRRDGANSHQLVDSVRGTGKWLESNGTGAEYTSNTNGVLTAFNSNGFTLTGGSTNANLCCESGFTYVAWAWDAGSSTVSNTDGSITSNVRANASSGCSIVTYTGNATAGATFGHGLGAVPEFVIIKSRDTGHDWIVYHSSIGNTAALRLNGTNVADTNTKWFNDAGPSSSTFTLGYTGGTNENGDNMLAYCFAPVKGYSAFGSYAGNSSDDGTFVFTGFRVKWVLIKCTDAAGQEWVMLDAVRNSYNVVDNALYSNTSDAEATGSTRAADFLSNGFKLRDGSSGATNLSGRTYAYAAFAEHPLKTSRAR